MVTELGIGLGTVLALVATTGIRRYTARGNVLTQLLYSAALVASSVGVMLTTLIIVPLIQSELALPTEVGAVVILIGLVGPIIVVLHHVRGFL